MNLVSATDSNALRAERGCLLYDVENVGGGLDRARQIRRILDQSRIHLKHVVVAGPRHQVSMVADAFRDCEALDERACPHGRQLADVELATRAGVSLVEAVQSAEYDALLIASADAAVIHCGRSWVEAGLPVYLLCKGAEASRPVPEGYTVVVYEIVRRNVPEAIAPDFDPEVYPFCFDGIPPNMDGLRVIKLPHLRDLMPVFLPLPLVASEFTIGAQPTACNIPLLYWDPDGKGGLYSPHAFIGYSTHRWYIRSAHGFRRGKRITQVNDRILAAQQGNVPLSDGDMIQIGEAKFELKCRPYTDFTGGAPLGANPHDQLAAVERWFHQNISEVLGRIRDDWWSSMIPATIQASCGERMSTGSTEHPYRYILLRELQDIVLACWVNFSGTPIRRHWGSKTQLRRTFSDLIEVRNKLMHPTRLKPTEMELGLLTRLVATLF